MKRKSSLLEACAKHTGATVTDESEMRDTGSSIRRVCESTYPLR